jgi:hypothetical protein
MIFFIRAVIGLIWGLPIKPKASSRASNAELLNRYIAYVEMCFWTAEVKLSLAVCQTPLI